jgi:hypothetical protein
MVHLLLVYTWSNVSYNCVLTRARPRGARRVAGSALLALHAFRSGAPAENSKGGAIDIGMVAQRRAALTLVAAATGAAAAADGGASIRCDSVKDTGFGLDFSSYPQECASNRGGSSSVQVKTYQEAFAASFDLSGREYSAFHSQTSRSATDRGRRWL